MLSEVGGHGSPAPPLNLSKGYQYPKVRSWCNPHCCSVCPKNMFSPSQANHGGGARAAFVLRRRIWGSGLDGSDCIRHLSCRRCRHGELAWQARGMALTQWHHCCSRSALPGDYGESGGAASTAAIAMLSCCFPPPTHPTPPGPGKAASHGNPVPLHLGGRGAWSVGDF